VPQGSGSLVLARGPLDRGPGASGAPFRPLQGTWEASPGSRGGCFYINPSRRGPAPVPGPRGRGEAPSRDLASWGAHPRPVQGRRDASA